MGPLCMNVLMFNEISDIDERRVSQDRDIQLATQLSMHELTSSVGIEQNLIDCDRTTILYKVVPLWRFHLGLGQDPIVHNVPDSELLF